MKEREKYDEKRIRRKSAEKKQKQAILLNRYRVADNRMVIIVPSCANRRTAVLLFSRVCKQDLSLCQYPRTRFHLNHITVT